MSAPVGDLIIELLDAPAGALARIEGQIRQVRAVANPAPVAADVPRAASGEMVEPTVAVERLRARGRLNGRGRTLNAWNGVPQDHLTRAEEAAKEDYPADVVRPQTREDCAAMPRPCPFVSCSHHLYLDVNPEAGAIKLNFPRLEVWEMAETCSLDVADRGGITLEEIGAILNLTRDWIRQIETRGLARLRGALPPRDT